MVPADSNAIGAAGGGPSTVDVASASHAVATGPELRTVRVGLVGAGFMLRPHSLAYQSLRPVFGLHMPRVELVRVFDVNPLAAAEAGRRFGWGHAATDWREVTRAPDIDVVDILTPNDAHAEVAIDAAAHGKHVLCEKPLAHRLEDARAMYEAVRDAGVVHQVGFVYRGWPAARLAKRVIEEGRLGGLRAFRGHYFHDYALDPEYPMSWRFDRSRSGGGSMGDIGSHVIDMGRYLVGEVDRVLARSRTFVGRRPLVNGAAASVRRYATVDVDDMSDALLEFDNGVAGVAQASWMAAGYKTDLSFEVTGEAGAVRFSWQRPNELQIYDAREDHDWQGFRSVVIGPVHEGAEAFWPVAGQGMGWGDAFLLSAQRFVEAVASERPVAPSFLDGVRALEVVDACRRSVQADGWVDVERHDA